VGAGARSAGADGYNLRVSKVGLIILLVAVTLAIAALSILRSYLFNLAALRKGFGRGRSATDWALRGMSGTELFAKVAPPAGSPGMGAPSTLMFCPVCHEQRPVFSGFCTACGCEITQWLIDEAKGEHR
jgi:hypothetical protein